MDLFLGIDVGSVSTNLVLIDPEGEMYLSPLYLRTQGQPIKAVQQGLSLLNERLADNDRICGVGTTGSARALAGVLVGADLVKNEITSHAAAALQSVPGVQTVLEIGGQDSKIIILKDGIVVDFAMNTVCAAGTGSFLDHSSHQQAQSFHRRFWRYSFESNKSCSDSWPLHCFCRIRHDPQTANGAFTA